MWNSWNLKLVPTISANHTTHWFSYQHRSPHFGVGIYNLFLHTFILQKKTHHITIHFHTHFPIHHPFGYVYIYVFFIHMDKCDNFCVVFGERISRDSRLPMRGWFDQRVIFNRVTHRKTPRFRSFSLCNRARFFLFQILHCA